MGVPPAFLGHYNDRVFQGQDFDHPAHVGDFFSRGTLQPAAKHRALGNGGVDHARQPGINRKRGRAGHFVGYIEASRGPPDEGPVCGVFERWVGGDRQLGGLSRYLAETQPAVCPRVADEALLGHTLGDRYAPPSGRGGGEHNPGRGPGLAQILVAVTDRPAASGQHRAVDAVAPEVFAGRRILGPDFAPVTGHLFGNQQRQAGEAALAHFHPGYPYGDAVVWVNQNPGGDFRVGFTSWGWLTLSQSPAGKRNFQQQAAANRGRPEEKRTTGEIRRLLHYHPLMPVWPTWPRYEWRPESAHRFRSGRYW